MSVENYIKGENEQQIWEQISADFDKGNQLQSYNAVITQGNARIILDIDVDLGGGFESGFSTTIFNALLPDYPAFRFAIHKEHFIDELGKFFGMQDVVLGYKEFDEKLIIKTTDKAAVRKLFASPELRETIVSIDDFTFGIHHHNKDGIDKAYLELYIETGITDTFLLRKLYNAFYTVYQGLLNNKE